MSPWHLLLGAALACGAFIPGPCNFDPQRRFDCNLADPCEENFACAADSYCKSADIACLESETRCEYPGLERVGLCVPDEDFASSKTHCGGCFARCLGGGACVEGACQGAPADGRCLLSRGSFDCGEGEGCVDDGDDDDEGDCKAGADGPGRLLEACESGDDCEGGLCDGGLCTSPCDFGCTVGTECDEDAIPGGLCVPGEELLAQVEAGEICR